MWLRLEHRDSHLTCVTIIGLLRRACPSRDSDLGEVGLAQMLLVSGGVQ